MLPLSTAGVAPTPDDDILLRPASEAEAKGWGDNIVPEPASHTSPTMPAPAVQPYAAPASSPLSLFLLLASGECMLRAVRDSQLGRITE